MKACPRCRQQYRDEIEWCADCHATRLVDEADLPPPAAAEPEPLDPDHLKEIVRRLVRAHHERSRAAEADTLLCGSCSADVPRGTATCPECGGEIWQGDAGDESEFGRKAAEKHGWVRVGQGQKGDLEPFASLLAREGLRHRLMILQALPGLPAGIIGLSQGAEIQALDVHADDLERADRLLRPLVAEAGDIHTDLLQRIPIQDDELAAWLMEALGGLGVRASRQVEGEALYLVLPRDVAKALRAALDEEAGGGEGQA